VKSLPKLKKKFRALEIVECENYCLAFSFVFVVVVVVVVVFCLPLVAI